MHLAPILISLLTALATARPSVPASSDPQTPCKRACAAFCDLTADIFDVDEPCRGEPQWICDGRSCIFPYENPPK